ncbi:hypothetical protein [Nocardia sp. NPDC058497]|uniref:hypothetical protein n=1 Tax=Nocardia sp. NPDC058497 TaxID=3346529 RepID=UPI0036590E7B
MLIIAAGQACVGVVVGLALGVRALPFGDWMWKVLGGSRVVADGSVGYWSMWLIIVIVPLGVGGLLALWRMTRWFGLGVLGSFAVTGVPAVLLSMLFHLVGLPVPTPT